jgi:tRNA threonylcarbamoyladenosine dehydratase
MTGETQENTDASRRWGGVSRLFGEVGLQRLLKAHVMVIGVGGVGSWAAEMLARSGVGKISLVDMDDVCESNINRQIHALQGTIGKSKVAVMAERLREIHPSCEVVEHHAFFTASTADSLLLDQPDWIFDAIDSMRHKVLLITRCKERGIPLLGFRRRWRAQRPDPGDH